MGQPPRIEAAEDLVRERVASGPAIAPVEGGAGELPQLEVRLEHFHRTSHGDRQMLAHGVGHLMGLAIAQRISQFGMAGVGSVGLGCRRTQYQIDASAWVFSICSKRAGHRAFCAILEWSFKCTL